MFHTVNLRQVGHAGRNGLNDVTVERKSWIKCNPKNFDWADWTGISSLPSNDRRKSGTLEIIWRLPNTMSFVLDKLRRRWLSKHQSRILHKSLFISAVAVSHCWTGKVSDSLLSSTYILHMLLCGMVGRSLT